MKQRVLKIIGLAIGGIFGGIFLLESCSSEPEIAPSKVVQDNPIIRVKPLGNEDLQQIGSNSVVEGSTENTLTSSLAEAIENDLVTGSNNLAKNSKIQETGGSTRPSVLGNNGQTIYVAELPVVPKKRKAVTANAQYAKKTSYQGPSLNHVKRLYKQRKYSKVIAYAFTSDELPQLYYKASAYFHLAHRSPKLSRRQIKYVQISKQLYGRIAETTRDKELKGRSLLWLSILRWRFPAWSEDLEQQLSPLLYIQRNLAKTRVYNDSLLYTAFIYEKGGRYDKAYAYYRKLEQTPSDDWVYDDHIKKFTTPDRASRWYVSHLEKSQVARWSKPSEDVVPVAAAVNTNRAIDSTIDNASYEYSQGARIKDPDSEGDFSSFDDGLQEVDFEVYKEATSFQEPPSLIEEVPATDGTTTENIEDIFLFD